jgi:hypothetical protein
MRYGSIFLGVLLVAGSAGCLGGDAGSSSNETVVSGAATASTEVFHSTWNGGSAYANAYGPVSYAYLNAWEGRSSGNTRTAGLYFYSYAYDPNSLTCVDETYCYDPSDPTTCYTYQYCYYANYSNSFGYGSIGSKDFVAGAHTAKLHTDLSADPNFYGQTCSYINGVYSCSATTGIIDLAWSTNGYYSSTQNGTQEYTSSFGPNTYTSRTVGQYSAFSANVAGTILGASGAGYGEVDNSKGTNISKSLIKN